MHSPKEETMEDAKESKMNEDDYETCVVCENELVPHELEFDEYDVPICPYCGSYVVE